MLQRSFRMTADSLADLNRIAEHLASLGKRAPNQTTALAWAISRGIDAMEAAERKAGKAADDIHGEMVAELKRLSDACEEWAEVVRKDRRARDGQTKDLRRLPVLEERLRQPDSAGRWVEVDDSGVMWICERQPSGSISKTRDVRIVAAVHSE